MRCSLCRVWVHVSACSSLGSYWNSEANLFGKLNAVQNRTTHRLCEQRGSDSTAGGRHTHTYSHTLTKWRLFVLKTLTLLSKSFIHWCIELGNNRRARAIGFHKHTAFERARQIRSEKHSFHVSSGFQPDFYTIHNSFSLHDRPPPHPLLRVCL